MIIRFLIFALFFFSVYGGINFYIFSHLKPVFPCTPGWKTGIIIFYLLVSLTPLLVRLMERVPGAQVIARSLGYIGYTWMGMLVFLFFIFVGIDLARLVVFCANRFFTAGWSVAVLTAPAAVWTILGLTGLIIIYGYFEAERIGPEKLVISSVKIPAEGNPLTIAQISDVHLGQLVNKRKLKKAINVVKAADPDILVCTGDLVDEDMRCCELLADIFLEVNPPLGKYAVTGNHEVFAGLKQAIAFMEKAGFKVLRNEAVRVTDHLFIAGVDDIAGRTMAKMEIVPDTEVLKGLPEEAFVLFLKHTPAIKPETEPMFDLMLSGHTHKGQMLPFALFTNMAFKYHAGLYTTESGSNVYVSRGTGTWGPPIRVAAAPEVTVIKLRHKD